MPYFVDTAFFVALKIADDDDHERAEEIFADVLENKYGALLASDYILDEAVTFVRRRTRNYDLAVEVIKMITNSKWVDLKYVTKEEVEAAVVAYKKYNDKDLSFTDWVSVKMIEFRGLHGIVSFDGHFDKVNVSRIC